MKEKEKSKLGLFGGILTLSAFVLKRQVDSYKLKQRAFQDMAEADAEEERRLKELQDIPKPESPEDVTIESREVTFETTDNESYTTAYTGLYCKGKFVDKFETKGEAEAARLQFLHDNGVENTEDFTL